MRGSKIHLRRIPHSRVRSAASRKHSNIATDKRPAIASELTCRCDCGNVVCFDAGRNHSEATTMVNWARLAEPQRDQYDSRVVLDFAKKRLSYTRPPIDQGPTIFDGAV